MDTHKADLTDLAGPQWAPVSHFIPAPEPGGRAAKIAGRPASPIPYSRVACDGNEFAYVREVLESGWLTTASKAQALERKFAEAVGAKFACAVNSCTSALHLGLERSENPPCCANASATT